MGEIHTATFFLKTQDNVEKNLIKDIEEYVFT